MNWLLLLKSLHVMAAIVAVGSNLTYGVWTGRAQADDAHLDFALRGVSFLDKRVANPAYGVLLLTGLLMAFLYYKITLTWILIGLVLYVVAAGAGAGLFGRAMRTQIATLASDGAHSAAYKAAASRAQAYGLFATVLVIAAVFVMVFKPQL